MGDVSVRRAQRGLRGSLGGRVVARCAKAGGIGPLYRRALAILEISAGPQSADSASVLFALARVCHQQGHNSEAEAACEQALPLWEKHLGAESRAFALRLYALAELYHVGSRCGRAERLDQRALGVLAKTDRPNSPEVVRALEAYATLLRQTKRREEASRLEARVKALRGPRNGSGKNEGRTAFGPVRLSPGRGRIPFA